MTTYNTDITASYGSVGSATFASQAVQQLDLPTIRDAAAAMGGSVDDLMARARVVNNRADVAGITVDSTSDFIITTGYAADGDELPKVYRRVGTEPTHSAKVSDASSAWFELVGRGIIEDATAAITADATHLHNVDR